MALFKMYSCEQMDIGPNLFKDAHKPRGQCDDAHRQFPEVKPNGVNLD